MVQAMVTLEAQAAEAEELVLLELAEPHITPRTQAVRHSTQLQPLAQIDWEVAAAAETPTAIMDTRPSSAAAEVVEEAILPAVVRLELAGAVYLGLVLAEGEAEQKTLMSVRMVEHGVRMLLAAEVTAAGQRERQEPQATTISLVVVTEAAEVRVIHLARQVVLEAMEDSQAEVRVAEAAPIQARVAHLEWAAVDV